MKTHILATNIKIISKKLKAKFLSVLYVLGAFFFLLLLANCGYYYKVREVDDLSNPDTQAKLNLKGKYVILRKNGRARNFYQIDIKDDIMSGQLRPLSGVHQLNLNPKKKGGNRYKKKLDANVVNEVHIHLSDENINLVKSTVSFPLSSIQKVQVYSKDGVATSLSWLLPPVLVIGAIVGITAATSCPFVYAFDGENYNLAGELYGGATYPSLERHDYMPMHDFFPHEGKYKIKISNELREIQHTNLCELLTVKHPVGTSVLMDRKGKIHTMSKPELPKRAITTNGSDVTFSVLEKWDYSAFAFDDEGQNHHVNGVVLTFVNKNKTRTGKLIVRAKNSSWADFAFGKFTHLFGSYYEEWENDQNKLPAKEMKRNAVDQDIPLSVFLETSKGWKFVDYYNVVGPIAYREMVIPIDLSEVKFETINIKLETGYKFWDLDYVGMDFSDQEKSKSTKLKLVGAVDENGIDVKSVLSKDDKNYLVQPKIGNEVILQYASKDSTHLKEESNTISVFLHSKGYYERIRVYDHQPDWISLIAHKHKHAFSKYSYNEYQKAVEEKLVANR